MASSSSQKILETGKGCRLFVGNLHLSLSEGDFIKIFVKCGNVRSTQYVWHRTGPQRGQPRGFAFVEMENHEGAVKAIATLHQTKVLGRPLVVRLADEHDSNDTSRYSSSITGGNSIKRSRDGDVKTTKDEVKRGKTIRDIDSRLLSLQSALKKLEEK